MKRELLYLKDIVEAAEAIQRFLDNIARVDFLQNDLLGSAVLQKLIVIGEAAARLSKDFRGEHSEIDWLDIIAFRNIAVHAYFSVDWQIVWTTATLDVPNLKQEVLDIILAGDAVSELSQSDEDAQ
jgi:uncharacterized protein with HEPN domain